LVLALLLLSLNFLNGCAGSSNTTKQAQTISNVKNPFTFDYKIDDSNLAFFTEGDSVNTLLFSSPFYTGSQPLPSQKTSEFDQARSAKIKQLLDEADRLVRTATRVKPKLATVRSSFLSYLTTSYKEEPKLEEFTRESFTEISLLMSKEQIAQSQYNSMNTQKATNPYAKSFEEYLKVTKAVELGGLYLKDVNNLGVYAALAMKALENRPNSSIKEANEKLDSDMQALDDIKDDLASISSSIEKIDYGMKQLRTADYYLAKEATQFMAASLPDLKAKANTLRPKTGLTADDIAFIKAYLAYFEKLQGALSENLDSIDKGKLISIDEEKESGIAIAYADGPGQNYGKAVGSLSAPLESKEKPPSGFFSKGWGAIKKTVNGAKLVVGLGVETTGIAIRNASQIACGIWAGNTAKEISEDMHNNSMELLNNFNKGVSGSSTFKTAGEYLENVEKAASDTAGSAVESRVGKGWTSWAAGGAARITVGMFTGLGKGIYKVARTDASYGEIAEGSLDIGLSFIGGSKAVIKLSQLPGVLKGLAKEGKLVGQGGINFLKDLGEKLAKVSTEVDIRPLLTKLNLGQQLTKEQALALIGKTAELGIKEAVLKDLEIERGVLIKEITNILKEGGTEGLDALITGIKQSLNELIKKSFEHNMQDYLRVISTVLGETGGDYLDNIVGSIADDYVKGLIKEAIDAGPQPEEISGVWKGTWVITEVLESESNSGKGKSSDGCDIMSMKDLKGKPMQLTLNLTVNSDGSGTMIASSALGNEKPSKGSPGTLSYADGTVTTDITEQGMQMHMEGKVQRTESGYVINGTLTAYSKNEPAIKGTWTVTKAK
ncbi:MAG: hypothetical protein ACYC56_05085, partial [Candidatus Aquicultor sp.]